MADEYKLTKDDYVTEADCERLATEMNAGGLAPENKKINGNDIKNEYAKILKVGDLAKQYNKKLDPKIRLGKQLFDEEYDKLRDVNNYEEAVQTMAIALAKYKCTVEGRELNDEEIENQRGDAEQHWAGIAQQEYKGKSVEEAAMLYCEEEIGSYMDLARNRDGSINRIVAQKRQKIDDKAHRDGGLNHRTMDHWQKYSVCKLGRLGTNSKTQVSGDQMDLMQSARNLYSRMKVDGKLR